MSSVIGIVLNQDCRRVMADRKVRRFTVTVLMTATTFLGSMVSGSMTVISIS